MFTLAVLTNAKTAPGFRLAGVEVVEAETVDSARRELVELLNDQRMGIIGVEASLADCIDNALQAKIDALYRPVVVILPSTTGEIGEESKRMYLQRIIKKAIGFEMKLG
jgi:V/A-type H+-transporting ATPase subunit F